MKAFAAICGLLVLATVAEAQYGRSCYSHPTYYPTYYAPTYYPTYVAPTYVQPYAVPVAVSKDYYYSVDSSYQQKLLVDALEGRMAARDRTFMVELFKQFQQMQQPQPQPYQQQQQPYQPKEQYQPYGQQQPKMQQPMPPAPKTEQLPDPKSGVPDGLQAIVDSKCLKCHQGQGAKGRFDMTNLARVPEALRWKAFGMVVTNEMPEGAPPLTDDEVIKFNKWAKLARQVSTTIGDVQYSPALRRGDQQ